jgi:hypothetical protein
MAFGSCQPMSERVDMSDLNEALLKAAEAGDLAAVTNALRDGADVNAGDGSGRTALQPRGPA